MSGVGVARGGERYAQTGITGGRAITNRAGWGALHRREHQVFLHQVAAKCPAGGAALRGRYSHLNITMALRPSPSQRRTPPGMLTVLLTGWSLPFRPKPTITKP